MQPPGPAAELRRALARRKKAELVDVLMEMAEADRAVLRRLTTRFDVAATTDDLVAATHQAIADATAFDKRDINRNFAYDYEAYAEVARNLGRLIASGQLRLAMPLALELMKRGSYQVEMSDEGLMAEDVEDCLNVVIEAVTKSDLPADEVLRVVFGAAQGRPYGLHRPTAPRGPAPSRRGGRGTITRRTFHQAADGPLFTPPASPIHPGQNRSPPERLSASHPAQHRADGFCTPAARTPLLAVSPPEHRQAVIPIGAKGDWNRDSQNDPVDAEAQRFVSLGREHSVEEDAAEGDLGAALVAERVIDDDPDHAPGDEMTQDQSGQDDAQVVPLPSGGLEDGVSRIVMPLGGPTGRLPDLADGARAEADDPTGEQRLEGLEDLRVEAIGERLYQCSEAGDKLIHGVDLRAVNDPGVAQHPPG